MKLNKSAENAGYLTAATLCITTGVVLIEKNLIAGAFVLAIGAGLFLYREQRKKK